MPDAKKRIVCPAGRWLQRAASSASNATSSGTRRTRPVAPERTMRCGASTSVMTCTRLRIAALRAALSIAAVSMANDSSRAREVPRGSAGTTIAARIDTIAITQTSSSSVKPSIPLTLPAGDVLRSACSTFCSIGSIREDVVGPVLPGRAVDVRVAPRVGRHLASFQVRAIPGVDGAGTAHQRGEAFGRVRIAPGVEKKQVERARKALDLDLGGLGFRLGQVVEHAWADDAHDQRDDRDDDQELHQREAALAVGPAAQPLQEISPRSHAEFHPTI